MKEFAKQKSHTPEEIVGTMLAAMEPAAFDAAVSLDGSWFLDNLVAAKAKSFEFPAKIYSEYGIDAPAVAQSLTIGTIHSVKGAEADVVIIFPDLSLRGAQQYAMRSGEGYEQILRQFYVAVTRTKHTLILCSGAANGMFFSDY